MNESGVYFIIIFLSIIVGLGTALLLDRLYIRMKEKNEKL